MERADETLIRDADLRERLEAARGNFVFQTIARTLVTEQQNRDREAAKQAERESTLAAMPRVRRKRKIIREVIETGEAVTAQNLRHIHSVLALCGLPHNKQPIEVREYERRQGRSSLVIEAGKLADVTVARTDERSDLEPVRIPVPSRDDWAAAHHHHHICPKYVLRLT